MFKGRFSGFFQLLIAIVLFSYPVWGRQTLEKFLKKPQLVVLVVIDQFRSDYLPRYANQFISSESSLGVGGFRHLMEKGAYFPFAHYHLMQAMTCPGHSMIWTGVYPSVSGIPLNDWYDRDQSKSIYCVSDSVDKISPRQLRVTTLSDEFRQSHPTSKVISLALKDRSAVMLGGQKPDMALWMNNEKPLWETSSYYGSLPSWVESENRDLQKLYEKQKQFEWKVVHKTFDFKNNDVLASPFGVTLTTRLALKALIELKLGQTHGVTDFLLISLSSHDLAGHQYGPDSEPLKDMTLFEDREMANLLRSIDKTVGLKKTIVALTADHGVAPSVDEMKAKGFSADRLDYLKFYKGLYAELDSRFGAPKEGTWIEAHRSLNFYLNAKVIKEKKVDKNEVLSAIKKWSLRFPGVAAVLTSKDDDGGGFDLHFQTEFHNQFIAEKSGDFILIPQPFHYEISKIPVTHMTPYNYDNRVPLIIMGSAFQAGVYSEEASVVDLVPTISYALQIIAPPLARGRILREALK